jgi:hypothetical protein
VEEGLGTDELRAFLTTHASSLRSLALRLQPADLLPPLAPGWRRSAASPAWNGTPRLSPSAAR